MCVYIQCLKLMCHLITEFQNTLQQRQNQFKNSVYGGKDGYVSDELCDGDVGEILMEQEWKRLTETFSNSHDDNTVEEWTPPPPTQNPPKA